MIAFKRVGKSVQQSAGGPAIFRASRSAWRTARAVYRHGECGVEHLGQQRAGKLLIDCGQRGGIGRQGQHRLRGGQVLLHAALMGLQLVQLLFQGLQAAAAVGQPLRVALKTQIAVPCLHGVHHLAAIFHGHCLVEQHHRIARGQFIGVAQIFKGRGAIVFAAGA